MKTILLEFAQEIKHKYYVNIKSEQLEDLVDAYIRDYELQNTKPYECEKTECNHFTPVEFNNRDSEGYVMCPNCSIEENNYLLKQAIEIIQNSGTQTEKVESFLKNFNLDLL